MMLRICVVWMTWLLCSGAYAAEVDSVRLWQAPDSTRIVFDLSGPVKHTLFTLAGPDRIVIDIENAQLASDVGDLPLAGTPIDAVRYGARGKNSLRVVLDMNSEVKPRSFVLPQHGDKADRLVVDLDNGKRQAHAKAVQGVDDLIPGKRDVIIAVDAGHGGEDPGAMGPRKIQEKDVVLAISSQLVDLINKQPGYTAYMVRTGDYYIPLRERRDRARQLRADLFVSVHADAFKNPNASGASVFALSRRGATSESARFLASKENEADLIGGVGGVSLTDVDNVLAGVLVDLSMTATLSDSLDVGSRVLTELGKIAKLHKPQVEQAGFAVLKSPDVPSILIETGFISNPQEASKLGTRSYQGFMASAIFNGIQSYFGEAPPAGSLLAWEKANGHLRSEHVISNGDTLSDIAKRYDVSLQELLKHNGLRQSTVIKIGQRLAIPTS